MIRKDLYMIYRPTEQCSDKDLVEKHFKSWKELHMFLFENGIFPEFQVYDNGESVLHYWKGTIAYAYNLKWDNSVPGSVVFEIVNKQATAKL